MFFSPESCQVWLASMLQLKPDGFFSVLTGAMYLDIISHFSSYSCFTYVGTLFKYFVVNEVNGKSRCLGAVGTPLPSQAAKVKGLQKLDDILLKWLAEYTRLAPRPVLGTKLVFGCQGFHGFPLVSTKSWLSKSWLLTTFIAQYLINTWRGEGCSVSSPTSSD